MSTEEQPDWTAESQPQAGGGDADTTATASGEDTSFQNMQDAANTAAATAAAAARPAEDASPPGAGRHRPPESSSQQMNKQHSNSVGSATNRHRHGSGGGRGGAPQKNREAMNVPVASVGASGGGDKQSVSSQLLDSARKVTTQERQRDREYKKTLIQQEKGNVDVDYSPWESGNAPDALSLQVARSITNVIRDAFSNLATMRREMRQRHVDALANGSTLSAEAGGAVQEALQSVYPKTTGLVDALEDGLRAVMPLFSASMRNTEGLTTLLEIRDQLNLETKRDVDCAQPTTASKLALMCKGRRERHQQQKQEKQQQQQAASFSSAVSDGSGSSASGSMANTKGHRISRLDSHPIYNREEEQSDHTLPLSSARSGGADTTPRDVPGAPMSDSARWKQQQQSSSGSLNNSNKNNVVSQTSGEHSNSRSAILTSINQVVAQVNEQAEYWPPDHRRHQAHNTLHQRVHPTKLEAAKRVEEAKAHILKKNSVESVIPPPLNKLLLASLPHSARSAHSGGDGAESARSSHQSIAEMKASYRLEQKRKQHEQQQQQQQEAEAGGEEGSSSSNTRRRSPPFGGRQMAPHEEMMARYPRTADGFAARILCLREAKLGVWRQLSVTEKQHIIAFEQRENRYHHAHGVNNMKLAGMRTKLRRGEKMGLAPTANEAAAMAEAAQRKRLLEEQRHADVRQTAALLRNWIANVPDRFNDDSGSKRNSPTTN